MRILKAIIDNSDFAVNMGLIECLCDQYNGQMFTVDNNGVAAMAITFPTETEKCGFEADYRRLS